MEKTRKFWLVSRYNVRTDQYLHIWAESDTRPTDDFVHTQPIIVHPGTRAEDVLSRIPFDDPEHRLLTLFRELTPNSQESLIAILKATRER